MTTNEHEIALAVLTERFDQLRTDHAQLSACIRDLSRTVSQLEKTVAAQSPWTALVQHLITVGLTAAITWWVSRKD
jgi:prefoldin subunit 5